MQESNKLTKKEFWSDGWRNIKLPARYFYGNYSHIVIDKLLSKYVSGQYKTFLEIGGCPGRWSDYFYKKHHMICDSLDYDKNNVDITRKNYALLGIQGEAFLGDITKFENEPAKKYDVVLSDGLVEHFVNSSRVFSNHLKFLNPEGLLIIGVPNIKKSWFYDFFAKKDKVGYTGYRSISKKELIKHAQDNNLEILFCDYVGVFNIGVVHSLALNYFTRKIFVIVDFLVGWFLKTLNIKQESLTFSPYIFLIAKK